MSCNIIQYLIGIKNTNKEVVIKIYVYIYIYIFYFLKTLKLSFINVK